VWAAGAAPAGATGGVPAPSRLSRLSRGASVGTVAAAGAVPLPGGTVPHSKAVQFGTSAAAGAAGGAGNTCDMDDVRTGYALQQQDQGIHLQGSGASRGGSEPQTPSAGGTSGEPSSADYQNGCSSSPDTPQQQQQQQQQQALLPRQSPATAAAAAAAAVGSPSAGLATLMQGLDTKGARGGDGTGRSPAAARRAGA
jgi:hypothetical protein